MGYPLYGRRVVGENLLGRFAILALLSVFSRNIYIVTKPGTTHALLHCGAQPSLYPAWEANETNEKSWRLYLFEL